MNQKHPTFYVEKSEYGGYAIIETKTNKWFGKETDEENAYKLAEMISSNYDKEYDR